MIGSWQAYEVDLPVGFAVSFAIRELFKNRPHLRPVFPLREYEMMPFIKIYQYSIPSYWLMCMLGLLASCILLYATCPNCGELLEFDLDDEEDGDKASSEQDGK